MSTHSYFRTCQFLWRQLLLVHSPLHFFKLAVDPRSEWFFQDFNIFLQCYDVYTDQLSMFSYQNVKNS